ncbi:response regulator [Bacteriovorax sp. Seq25_V]|uniref:response regulator n=1 Tax=Bacteriovorax sp. Seq25_V TaxID=1201288 RepID=UPI00038A0681|nr:response regulator transcription factor [Bacteriovorax sp. Seq25_V]EQC45535.1 response regulator receiver domain protein [Bacteriovorax sp. Seq25_V]
MSEFSALIVEDENAIANLIKVNLETLGITATIINQGREAITHLQNSTDINYSLIILDRMLPALDGIEICKFIRMYERTKNIPVLMVTALTKPSDIVDGLEAGADDYITKPFDINVLKARVKSLLRRYQPEKEEEKSGSITDPTHGRLSHRGITVDTEQCRVWTGDDEISLTVSEYKLLCTLLERPGKVLTRKYLVETIQGGPIHVTERTIDTHIFGLRKKLNNYSNFIETIRGIGYRILND